MTYLCCEGLSTIPPGDEGSCIVYGISLENYLHRIWECMGQTGLAKQYKHGAKGPHRLDMDIKTYTMAKYL